MKPGVEDSSMTVNSSCTPASMALSIRETTAVITFYLYTHIVSERNLSRRRGIVCPFNCGIAPPAIVLIVTAASASAPKKMARHSVDGVTSSVATIANADDGLHNRSDRHMRTVTPPFCDPVHSIEHRTPLFAYRGFRKRHHQRKEEACAQL